MFSIVGSYDVLITHAALTDQSGFSCGMPVSQNQRARLDIRKAPGAGYDLMGTLESEEPLPLVGSIDGGTMYIEGPLARYIDPAFNRWTIDRWKHLEIPLQGASLGSTMSLRGQTIKVDVDYQTMCDATAVAAISADVRAPELQAYVDAIPGKSTILPWSTLTVIANEPVNRDGVLHDAELSGLPLNWAASDGGAWVGERLFVASMPSWSSLAIDGGSLAFRISGEHVHDLAGHVASALNRSVTFEPLGNARALFDFESAPTGGTLWNASVAEPLCESGRCAVLGPVRQPCGSASTAGFAALVSEGPMNTTSIRYRLLARQNGASISNAFVATLVSEHGAREQFGAPAPVFTSLSTPIDGFAYATDWLTFDMTSSQTNVGQRGIVVSVGTTRSCDIFQSTDEVELVVESVQTK